MSNESSINSGRVGKLDIDQNQLTLPFSQGQFQNFISGLFGKPDRFQRIILGEFEIDLGDIKNLHFIIQERINQQNKAILVQFSSKIFYDDNSSILLNSFEKLSNYSEPRSVIPIRVELSWQYLIKFQDRDVPEKQEIELYITTEDISLYQEKLNLSRISLSDRSYSSASGFALDINYTARTWATDIDSMLNEHIKDLVALSPARSRFSQLISDQDTVLFFVATSALFFISIIGSFISSRRFISSRLENAALNISGLNLDSKIDFLITYISSGEGARFYFFLTIFLIVMFILSFIAGNFISSKAHLRVDNSYILLTKKSRSNREDDRKIEKNQLRNIVLSVILSGIGKIISNYLFLYLTTSKY